MKSYLKEAQATIDAGIWKMFLIVLFGEKIIRVSGNVTIKMIKYRDTMYLTDYKENK